MMFNPYLLATVANSMKNTRNFHAYVVVKDISTGMCFIEHLKKYHLNLFDVYIGYGGGHFTVGGNVRKIQVVTESVTKVGTDVNMCIFEDYATLPSHVRELFSDRPCSCLNF